MQPVPQLLKIVAYLFIIGGICAAIEVVMALLESRISINLGVLGLFIGQGLLRFNPRSRAWALFFIWLGLIIMPIAAVLFLFTPGDWNFFGMKAGQAPPGVGFVFSSALFALTYWQYKVLTNREIRRLFAGKPVS